MSNRLFWFGNHW